MLCVCVWFDKVRAVRKVAAGFKFSVAGLNQCPAFLTWFLKQYVMQPRYTPISTFVKGSVLHHPFAHNKLLTQSAHRWITFACSLILCCFSYYFRIHYWFHIYNLHRTWHLFLYVLFMVLYWFYIGPYTSGCRLWFCLQVLTCKQTLMSYGKQHEIKSKLQLLGRVCCSAKGWCNTGCFTKVEAVVFRGCIELIQ